jgi:6-phosphofructokinase 1
MGRHAGWLTAAAALANVGGCGPDLIYVPEIDFDLDAFTAKVKGIYEKQKKCFVVVSEGIHDKEGTFIAEYANKNMAKDSFGHAQLGGTAAFLANYIKEQTGAKVRGIELSLLQRCAAHIASQTDIDEAFGAGQEAVRRAVAGETGKMIAFERETVDGQYRCKYAAIPLAAVANFEKKIPPEWINAEENGLTQDFIDYVRPLVQGRPDYPTVDSMPRYARLRKVLANQN